MQTGSAVLLVAGAADAGQLHPGFEIEELGDTPLLQVMAVMVEDPDRAASLLKHEGVACRRDASGAVLVQPQDASGVCLELVPG